MTRLHRQGQFWHIFFIGDRRFCGAIIAQDEKDTWTVHLHLPLHINPDTVSSHDAVYIALGGGGAKYEIAIDEILVRSTYRPSIAIARQYNSPKGTIFLAGDSAHQNIPTGGYGMNMGLGDAFDLGWKLAAVIKGYGGPALLQSYEDDRRPVAMNTIERSGVHMAVHTTGAALLDVPYEDLTSEAGMQAVEKLRQHYLANDSENKDIGIEMGYRYKSSICIPDPSIEEPEWTPSRYIPSTFPGSRAPHVFLKDGSAIFDQFGNYFSLVHFLDGDETESSAKLLLDCARQKDVPLKLVSLIGEDHARNVWGNVPLVIVRPDSHVAWRGKLVPDNSAAAKIIDTIFGRGEIRQMTAERPNGVPDKAFSATTGLTVQESQYELEKGGAFQS